MIRQYELVTVQDGGMAGAIYHHSYLIVYGAERRASLDARPISRATAARTLLMWRHDATFSNEQWIKRQVA